MHGAGECFCLYRYAGCAQLGDQRLAFGPQNIQFREKYHHRRQASQVRSQRSSQRMQAVDVVPHVNIPVERHAFSAEAEPTCPERLIAWGIETGVADRIVGQDAGQPGAAGVAQQKGRRQRKVAAG